MPDISPRGLLIFEERRTRASSTNRVPNFHSDLLRLDNMYMQSPASHHYPDPTSVFGIKVQRDMEVRQGTNELYANRSGSSRYPVIQKI